MVGCGSNVHPLLLHEMNIDPKLHFLIHGKHENGILLMIPVHSPKTAEYLAEKYIGLPEWVKLVIEKPNHEIMFSREPNLRIV